ncbi:hypothetical protein [Clostridium sp. UBA5119]
MKKKRKLNATVTMGPNTSRLVTESLLRLVDSNKEEFLQILKGR